MKKKKHKNKPTTKPMRPPASFRRNNQKDTLGEIQDQYIAKEAND